MEQFSDFFSQAYWWLSLLGGGHCLALALYIRYLYRDNAQQVNNRLLASIFSLLALYFFTGMLNSSNAPLPIHLLFTLIIPIYFLLMPLLYLYCQRLLDNRNHPVGFSKHFIPACTIAAIVVILSMYHVSLIILPFEAETADLSIELMTLLGTILPGLLSLQTAIYFYLILKVLKRRNTLSHPSQSIHGIKFRWLMVLTLALMGNWLLRTLLVTLPFYFGDELSTLTQAFTRLSMLLTVYALAIYGLQQLTRAAYLRGALSSRAKSSTHTILEQEELTFLQSVLKPEQQQSAADQQQTHTSDKDNGPR